MTETLAPQSHSSSHLEEDQRLLELAKSNPDQAFADLYKKYVDRIYAFIMKRIRHEEEALDATSRVFLAAYRRLPHFTWQGHSFGSYLYKIASRELISFYRQSTKEQRNVEIEEHHAVHQTTEHDTEVKLSMEKVLAVLPELGEAHRAVIDLKYFGELSNQEIAKALGWSPNKVAVTALRALRKVKELVQDRSLSQK